MTQADWNRLNRAIRATCSERSISEDERKLTMKSVTGKASSKDCSLYELQQVLSALKSKTTSTPKRPFKASSKAYVRKIWALWGELAKQGKLKTQNKDAQRTALVSFVNNTAKKSYAKPEQLDWLTYAEANTVIEALKKWIERE